MLNTTSRDVHVDCADPQLPAKRIAHTVGPIYSLMSKEEAARKLRSCYQTSLELCQKHGGGSIGFSSISTGVCESNLAHCVIVAAI